MFLFPVCYDVDGLLFEQFYYRERHSRRHGEYCHSRKYCHLPQPDLPSMNTIPLSGRSKEIPLRASTAGDFFSH